MSGMKSQLCKSCKIMIFKLLAEMVIFVFGKLVCAIVTIILCICGFVQRPITVLRVLVGMSGKALNNTTRTLVY